MATAMIGKIRTKVDSVTVEYDCSHLWVGRTTKTFISQKQSKAFYEKMMREGRNPRIIRAELN